MRTDLNRVEGLGRHQLPALSLLLQGARGVHRDIRAGLVPYLSARPDYHHLDGKHPASGGFCSCPRTLIIDALAIAPPGQAPLCFIDSAKTKLRAGRLGIDCRTHQTFSLRECISCWSYLCAAGVPAGPTLHYSLILCHKTRC